MVDESPEEEHYYAMLTTKDNQTAKSNALSTPTEADLKFLSENQRMEGFSGEIPPQLRQHMPDLNELEAVAERFGAQAPKVEKATKH